MIDENRTKHDHQYRFAVAFGEALDNRISEGGGYQGPDRRISETGEDGMFRHQLAASRHTAPSCRETYAILGRLGKVIFRMKRLFFLLALPLAVFGCHGSAADGIQSGKVIGIFGLEGRWVGPVTPKIDGCGQTTTGLMSVSWKTFAFDPFQGTTIIKGTVADTGLQGTLARPGNGQQLVSIGFSGSAKHDADGNEVIEGQLKSGRCSWAVNLKQG
jgi:hypothetical protein